MLELLFDRELSRWSSPSTSRADNDENPVARLDAVEARIPRRPTTREVFHANRLAARRGDATASRKSMGSKALNSRTEENAWCHGSQRITANFHVRASALVTRHSVPRDPGIALLLLRKHLQHPFLSAST